MLRRGGFDSPQSTKGTTGSVCDERGSVRGVHMKDTNGITACVGSSAASDAGAAGREAATGALAGLRGQPPALVIVYASVSYDLPALLGSIRDVTGIVPLVGATTAGQFHEGTFVPPGGGVEVLALTAGPYSFGVAAREGLAAGDAEDLGRRLAAAARAAAAPATQGHAAVMLLSDGMAGHQQHLLNGVYEVTGAGIPVFGGAASDDFAFRETFVFEGDRVLRGLDCVGGTPQRCREARLRCRQPSDDGDSGRWAVRADPRRPTGDGGLP